MADLGPDPSDWSEDPTPQRPEPTGFGDVDAVVDAVAGAADQPLAEQVAIFEQAHAGLRRSLDATR